MNRPLWHHSTGVVAEHAPGQRGHRAKALLVHKITPAPHALANEKAQRGQVQYRRNGKLPPLGHQTSENHGPNKAAIDGNAAIMDKKNLDGVVPIFIAGIENHVVQPGAHNASHRTSQHRVNQAVHVDAHFFRAAPGIDHGQKEAHGNDDSIPANVVVSNGKGHLVYGKPKPQSGELHQMAHLHPSFLRPKTFINGIM